MELLPLGPVVMIDTPGLDDEGELGALRVKKAMDVLNKTDIAVLVISAEDYLNTGEWSTQGLLEKFQRQEKELLELIKEKKIPFVIVLNKADLFYSQEMVEKISEKRDGISDCFRSRLFRGYRCFSHSD
jgi:predicted GTPase